MNTWPAGAPPVTIAQGVLDRARLRGSKPALYSQREGAWQALSSAELAHQVTAVAAALAARHIAAGDRVGLIGSNSPAWAVAYLAIQHAGGVVVPLDRMQTAAEWHDVLLRSGARGVLAGTTEGERLFAGDFGGAEVPLRVWLDREDDARAEGLSTLASAGAGLAFEPPACGPDDLAVIIYTSGTTGKSKGVMLTHGNILANADAMIQTVGISAEHDRFLSVLPLHHCYEATCGLVAPLLAGARVYFARSLAPTELLADLASAQATFLLGVPLLYEKFVAGIERGLRRQGVAGRVVARAWDLSVRGRRLWGTGFGRLFFGSVRRKAGLASVRFLISGGAPLPPQVGYRLQALGLNLLQGYGLTETSPVATLTPPADVNPASVGLPLPGVEIRIATPDETGKGEIWLRGPTVMRGYWQDEEATRAVMQDGWFKTGDLGYRDGSGHLFIAGRTKNLIVTPGGKNISPEEIELAASESPLISEIVVYGRPAGSGAGEEVCARVFPDIDRAREQGIPVDDDAALRTAVRADIDRATSGLAAYKRIVHLELMREPFPKTTSQKIKRHLPSGGNPP